MTGVRPKSIQEAASELAGASAAGQAVRIVGGASKLGWGSPVGTDVELHTSDLDEVVEHNAGDLTAVLQGGVPLVRAQEMFATAGQTLALDPWLGVDGQATIGGVLAAGDCGPLAHRYGGARDLVLGMTVVLADGTVARSGGRVIKNVAGYDVAKLFCGSFGTLGLIASVNIRLHPQPVQTVTALGETGDPLSLAQAARILAAAPLECEALDIAWAKTGRLLARCGGPSAPQRAEGAALLMRDAGLAEISTIAPDDELWEEQRAAQRSAEAAVVRVSARPSQLEGVLRAAIGSGARIVGRAALGLSFLTVDPSAVERLLRDLPSEALWVLLDAPDAVRRALNPWGAAAAEPGLELMRQVKARFDPTRTCNPGLFVGGI
jgi:glycolate oxidase FAD binding subunit